MKKLIPVLILHLLALIFVRYIAWPENLLWPHLALNGLTVYKNIFFIYPPLYFQLLSSWDKIFGVTLTSLIGISYLNIIVTDILLFLVAKKRIVPVLIYIPIQLFFEGNGFWPDQLLAPLFLACWLSFQNKKYFLLGIFLGLSAITKQTAVYFIFGVLSLFAFSKPRIAVVGKLIAGLLLIILLLTLYLLINQNYQQFWDQTIIYIFSYHTKNSLQVLWPNKQQIIATLLVFVPILFSRNRKVVMLTVLASLGIFTRFEYFHLQPTLPFVALLLSETLISVPFLIIFSVLFFRFFSSSHNHPPRFYDPELFRNAATINTFIPRGSKTLFMNTWDHYYYLTGTIPVGSFFYSSTPWNWGYDGLQSKTVEILKTEKPKFVIYGSCFAIDGICYRPEITGEYIKENYKRVSETSDGAGIFEYNPVSPGQETQAFNGQKQI